MYNAPATGSININKTSEDGVIEGLSFKLESFDDEREFGDDLIPTPMAYDAAGNEITSIVLTTDKTVKQVQTMSSSMMSTVIQLTEFCHMYSIKTVFKLPTD